MSDAQDDPKSTQPDAAAPESVTEAEPPPAQAPIAKRRGSVDEIARAAGRTERRMRFVRALAWGTTALCVGLGAAGITLAIRKTDTIGDKATKALLVAEGLAVFAVASAGWMRRLPNRAGAITLDRHHGLHDRLSSALSFADEKERSPFMDAAIDDALAVVHTVEPRKAVPVRAPRDLAMAAVLGLAVTAVALFEVREHKPAISQKTIDPVDVTADDLDAMRDFLKDQEMKNQSDEAKEATKEFNQLIEDLAAKRLDRTEAFRRMQALEDKLLQGREVDHKQLEEQLQQIGEALKKSDMSKPAGEALDQHNLSDAQKQLRDLANKLRQNGGQIDKAQLEKLREALKQASQDAEKHKEAVEKARDQAKQELSLLKQKQGDAGPQTDEERSLLEKKERELDRLEHELQQADATQRQLDKLDQDLQKAAEDLMKDLGLSAQDLENGAEDLNKMQQQEMTQQEKEELKQKLDELREMLRQQGQGGQQQMVRLQKFQQQAHGQGGQQGQGQGQGQQQGGQQQGQGGQQGQGQQGQGQQGQGQQGQGQQGQGQQGQGQQGQGQNGQGQNGQGQNGQGQGQNGQGQGQGAGQGGAGGSQPGPGPGEVWVIGPNGEKILVLTKGQGQGQGQGQGGQGQGGQGGQGGQQGPGWGTGSGGNPQGQQSSIKYGTQDSQIAGQDTGQGGSRSEVIQGAAERGFASRGYQKVYREYHTVAEEALNKDEIPGGYRFYVKRYFQLIRPRDQ